MILVYIASPFSGGDKQFNLDRQNEVANVLLNEGYVPLPPLLIGESMERMQARTWDEWLEACFEWVARCDVLLRLEGESVGADAEVVFAKARGIPVVYSVDELRRMEAQ